MDRRFWVGLAILILFLALGVYTAAGMQKIHQPMAEKLHQASVRASEGALYQGVQLAISAKKDWLQHWRITAAVADHEPMEQIDGLFAQLDGFAATGDTGSFAAVAGRLSKLVEAIGEAHSLSWWNLL